MQLNAGWLAEQGQDAALLKWVHDALMRSQGPVGVAVSGGGDSMAALLLVARWAKAHEVTLAAVTVDHGLRAESAAEARQVAGVCAGLGIDHDTLVWSDWDGHGNVQAAAREARYRLIGGWAARRGIAHMVLGHTQDDAAETFVMRLARKAGIDGLALMDRRFQRDGVQWLRPFLDCARGDLRACLRRNDVGWVEDPSNEDVDFERVRVRQALDTLAGLGVSGAALTHAGRIAKEARQALDHYTRHEARLHIVAEAGDLILRPSAEKLPPEMARRLWSKAVQWVGRLDYPPRSTTLSHLQTGLALNGTATGGGCLLRTGAKGIRVAREANAVKVLRGDVTQDWDRHWRLEGPHKPGLHIAALGEGIADCPDWRGTGLPRGSLMAGPAIWRGADLVAAPLAGLENGWSARIVADFHSWLEAH